MYAMMTSLVIYILVVEIINRTTTPPVTEPDIGIIRYVIYAMAVSMIFLSQVIKMVLLRGAGGADLAAVLQKLQAANAVVAALAEVPVVMGLVMFIVWRQYTDFYILAFVSLYIMLRHFPRYSSWERAAAPATGGGE